ncbi:site-specific integrase [Glaesserella parasuis]|uniref:tyrosine-type recombinase/integrase n=1 Tax=Glaesserella parasuis TaxID=738 RepID=UPI002436FEF6|nr:site-specific integrase [Glaesserella parasuis]MDG6309918.1 site-specific integrase [Glaesserella parasuis]
MSIYKRDQIYWVAFTTPSGKRIRRSTGTTVKKEAQEFYDKIRAEMWRLDKLDERPDYLFEQALLDWLKQSAGLADQATKKRHAIYWRSKFAGRGLSTITGAEAVNALPKVSQSTGKPLSNATQNKYIKSLARIFSLAYQAGYIDKVPHFPKKKEPPIRVRWITQEQARRLISNIGTDWMKAICSFALMTGARRTEILTMTWDKIDFDRKIAIVSNDIAKSEKARSLLLNDEAIELLKNQREKHGKYSKYVFVSARGNPVDDINRKTFDRATRLTMLQDFHFHDLRHTWASWHVQAGTPLFSLKELGGWETLEMVKKYAHLNADHLMAHAGSVKFVTQF